VSVAYALPHRPELVRGNKQSNGDWPSDEGGPGTPREIETATQLIEY